MRASLPRRNRRRLRLAGLALGLLPLLSGPVLAADAATDAFYRRASACVAVMKQDVVVLTARHQAGATTVRPDIQRLTELGFTFVGTAYKRGLRKAQADQMLADAEASQKGQGADALKKLSTECQAEGARLLAKANVIERALVANRARARVDKLLEPEPAKSSS